MNRTLIAQALRPIINSMGQHETENLCMVPQTRLSVPPSIRGNQGLRQMCIEWARIDRQTQTQECVGSECNVTKEH